MPGGWNGSGTFTRYYGTDTWQNDAANGTLIVADRHDNNDQGMATGINACLTKNGENTFTGSAGALRASVDNTVNLGSTSLRWQSAFLGTSLVFQGATYATTVTAAPTANRALVLPNTSGTVGLAGVSLAAVSFTGTATMDIVASGLSAPGYSMYVLSLKGVSLSGTNNILIQLADLSGFLTSSYNGFNCIATAGGNTLVSSSAGFPLSLNGAAQTITGAVILTRSLSFALPGADTWMASGNLFPNGATNIETVAGNMQMTVGTPKGVLDGIRLRSSGGVQTFDAGDVTLTGYL